MVVTISTIFSSVNMAIKIAGYLQFIETSDEKLNRLTRMHQIAAKEALEHALRVVNQKEAFNMYVNRAIEKYLDAISIEKEEGLFAAYIGLAFCNQLTKDESNMEVNLSKAISIYKSTKHAASSEPDSIMDAYTEADQVVLSIATLGIANLFSSGIKSIEKRQIEKDKERLRIMAPIAEDILRNYKYLDK